MELLLKAIVRWIFAALVGAVLVGGVVGCQNQAQESPPTGSGPTETQTPAGDSSGGTDTQGSGQTK